MVVMGLKAILAFNWKETPIGGKMTSLRLGVIDPNLERKQTVANSIRRSIVPLSHESLFSKLVSGVTK